MSRKGSYIGGSTIFRVGDPSWGSNELPRKKQKRVKPEKNPSGAPKKVMRNISEPSVLDINSKDPKIRSAAKLLSKKNSVRILKPIPK